MLVEKKKKNFDNQVAEIVRDKFMTIFFPYILATTLPQIFFPLILAIPLP